jgi:hypothetical protein
MTGPKLFHGPMCARWELGAYRVSRSPTAHLVPKYEKAHPYFVAIAHANHATVVKLQYSAVPQYTGEKPGLEPRIKP